MKHLTALLLSFLLCVLSGCGSGGPRAPKSAAETAFDAANLKITSSADGTAHGNTDEAKKMAAEYSDTIEKLQQVSFSGGDKNRKFSLTGEKFLVHCQLSGDSACFLVHVPQLKGYKDEVRVMLAKIAFTTAKMVTANMQKEKPVKLAVGLRGTLLYGATAIGNSDAEPKIEQGYSVPDETLHPYFQPASAAAPTATPPAASDSKEAKAK